MAHLLLRRSTMWFIRKPPVASDERVQIRAKLKQGETLHITFSDESDDLDIEGTGEIRLAIRRPRHMLKAEVVRGTCTPTSASSG